MKLKITFWIFSFLFSVLFVTANHGGNLRAVNPDSTRISTLWLIIIIPTAIGLLYLLNWLILKKKKKL